MLRETLNTAMKDAMRNKDARKLATVRLILAAIKDRDIAVRGEGGADRIDDAGILELLGKMIKQRQESAKVYEQGGRTDLMEQELAEVEIIKAYLPPQLDEAGIKAAAEAAVAELEANGLNDIGRVMALLKERHAGQMDFSRASAIVRQLLS